MDTWVTSYRDVMGFQLYHTSTTRTLYGVFGSDVESDVQRQRTRKVPHQRTRLARKNRQIEEYLEFYGGPGVQHIAMATGNSLRRYRGCVRRVSEFLRVPNTYYDDLGEALRQDDEPINELADLGILVDRDDEGYMLQIFTKPVEDRQRCSTK